MNGERSVKNDAVGNCAQLMKGDHVIKNDVDSEDSEQTSRDDGSANKHSQKLSTSKPPSNASGQQWRVSAWEDRMIELAAYREIHGHCNVSKSHSENIKLANWVATQRTQYRLHLEGKTSSKTLSRIQGLESLGFDWKNCSGPAWEDRLSELAAYREIQGHCNVSKSHSENIKLANWVATQRTQYRLHLEGKTSSMTLSRIQGLESLGFDWGNCSGPAWEYRLSELADYRKIHGHCNVPKSHSECSKLANWVAKQRTNYRLHLEGKTSSMTLSRIQEMESLGFDWGVCSAPWEYRLSELAAYREIHGHCNVPQRCSENSKLAKWVVNQRTNYRLHLKGKTSSMTLSRIQELESLGFEWDCSGPT
jgi:hypothetical protein